MVISELSYEKAVYQNVNYFQSCGKPFNRQNVIKAIGATPERVFKAPEKYAKTTLPEKVIRRGLREFRKFKSRAGLEKRKCYLDAHTDPNDRFFSDRSDCCGCGMCANICPTGAITMKLDNEGFRYPIIDSTKCCKCGKCVKYCSLN